MCVSDGQGSVHDQGQDSVHDQYQGSVHMTRVRAQSGARSEFSL